MVEEKKRKARLQGKNFRWVVLDLPIEVWNNKEQYKIDLLTN